MGKLLSGLAWPACSASTSSGWYHQAPAAPGTSASRLPMMRIVRVLCQCRRHILDHINPYPNAPLAKEAHRGIPRTIVALTLPAPIRGKRQQQPHRLLHRRRQMGHGSVHADDQVQIADQCRRIRKIMQLRCCIHHADSGRLAARLRSVFLLQAEKLRVRHLTKRRQQ